MLNTEINIWAILNEKTHRNALNDVHIKYDSAFPVLAESDLTKLFVRWTFVLPKNRWNHEEKRELASQKISQEGVCTHPDGEHGDALWAVDAVPDADVASVLGNHHVAAGHPLDVRAETEQRGFHPGLDVVQVELRRSEKTKNTRFILNKLKNNPLRWKKQGFVLFL